MVSKLERNGDLVGETLEDMNWRIDDFEKKHAVYISHIIRGYHEINEKNKVYTCVNSLRYHKEVWVVVSFRKTRYTHVSIQYCIS